MRSWPIRRKLLAGTVLAAVLLLITTWAVLESGGYRFWLIAGLDALTLGIMAAAWAVADAMAKRVARLQEQLAQLPEWDAVPVPGPVRVPEVLAAAAEIETPSRMPTEIYSGGGGDSQLRRTSEFLEFAQAAGGFGVFDLDLVTGQITSTPLFFELLGLPNNGALFTRDEWLATVHPEDFEGLLETLNAAIDLDFGRKNCIVSANYLELLGLPATTRLDDFEAQLATVHPEDVELIRSTPFAATRDHPSYHCEYRVLLPGGAIRWIAETATVEHDRDDKVTRITGSLVDVTHLKTAEAAVDSLEKRLARTMRATRDGVWEFDITDNRVWYGPRFEELLGYGTGELDQSREGLLALM